MSRGGGPDGQRARISYDRLGRPVVSAGSTEDAAYGLGWCLGVDRRPQMDVLRRTSQGRLAELVGSTALTQDVRQRRLGLESVARDAYRTLPEEQDRLLTAFADGVNDAAPPANQVPAWTPVDSIAVAQRLFQSLASDGSELRMVEVMRRTLPPDVVEFLIGGYDPYETGVDGVRRGDPPPAVPVSALAQLMAQSTPRDGRVVVSAARPVGSNAWAVAGDRRALLANDTHLELTRPSLWYAATLVMPDTVVVGVTIPGVPVIVVGATESLAWGYTRLPGDVADLREVTADDEVTVRRERIVVRGGEEHLVEVRDTRWGPVVGELAGRPVAFASTLTDHRAIDFATVALYRATSVDDGVAVVTDAGLPPVNVVLADRSGRIAWTVGGRFPDRGASGPRGFSPRREWAMRRPEDLPRLVDPPSRIVVTCNNATDEARAAGVAWNFFGGARAARIADVVDPAIADEASLQRLQLDLDARFYRFYRDLALRHLPAGRPGSTLGRLAALRREIEAWTGTADRTERGLALLVVFRDLLREELVAAVTGPSQRYDPEFTYCRNGHEGMLRQLVAAMEEGLVPPPWVEPRRFVVAQVLTASAILAARSGEPEPAAWGRTNVLTRIPVGGPDQEIAPEPYIELSGAPETVCVAEPDFGAAVRLVVDPGAWTDGLISIPGSPDGRAAGDRWAVARWAAGLGEPLTDMP